MLASSTALLVLLMSAAPQGRAGQGSAGVQVREVIVEPELPPVVGLSELRAHPTLWLGREARFVLQFDAPRKDRDAPFGGMDSSTHWAFRAWGDEQPLWDAEEFADPGTRLFVRLGSPAEMRLRVARRFERFEAHGRVRQVLAGEPWIEIDTVHRLSEAVGEGSLIHATRALRLVEEGHWFLAADQFDRSLAARLPQPARVELERLRDECRRRFELERQIKKRGVF